MILFFLLLFEVSIAVAQDNPGGPTGGGSDAPVDGGLSVLIAAGIGYGAKRLHERKHKP